jgi:hypothetical protein
MFLASLLSSCFQLPSQSKGSVQVLNSEPRAVVTRAVGESKAVASFDPNSKVATTIDAPKGALAGSSITLPAGSLSIAAELIVEEAVSLSETSLTASVGISADVEVKPVGAGLIIRPSEAADLTQPLTIAMPINPFSTLRGWIAQTLGLQTGKYYAVFFKYFVQDELKAGVIPTSELRLTSEGLVLFEGYFGAYWLVEVSAPIEQRVEVVSQEPIVNKDRVAVIESTGFVSEQEVVAKAQIPLTTWGPVTLVFEETGRQLQISAAVDPSRTVSQCKLDLFRDQLASSGWVIDTQNSLSASITIDKPEAQTFQARFRCIDDQDRLTVSAWSSLVNIPAISVQWTTPILKLSGRDATLSATINSGRSVKNCRAEFSEDGGSTVAYEAMTETSLNHIQKVTRTDVHTLQGRFRCTDDVDRETLSSWSSPVPVPALIIVNPVWASVNLVFTPTTRLITLTGTLGAGQSAGACSALFSENPDAASGAVLSTGQSLVASYTLTNLNAHTLYARFQCFDSKDAVMLSPVASFEVPAYSSAPPVLAAPSNRLYPSNFVRAGTMYSLNFDNVASSPFSDFGMTYVCSFMKLAVTNGPSTNCSSISGAFSFSNADGTLNWSPAAGDVGAYQFTVAGTNAAGTSSQSFLVHVAPNIDMNQQIFSLDGRFADGVRGGQNSTANTLKWFDLTPNGRQSILNNFYSMATWYGTNTSGDPVHLRFDGLNDYVSVPTLNFSTLNNLRFETWFMNESNASEKVIMTNGGSNQRGWTLTDRRVMLGLNLGSNYPATVLADNPRLYWRFDNVSSGIMSDASVHGQSGTTWNPANVQQVQETALADLTNGNSATNVGNGHYRITSPFASGQAWTIETWFRYPLSSCAEGWCSLVRGITDNEFHFAIVNRDSQEIGIYMANFQSSGYSLQALSPGWYHLAAVGQGGTTQFYLNGSPIGSAINGQPTGQIGLIGGEGVFAWGQIDELAIYTSALSSSQVQSHFLAGYVPQCTYKTTPGAWQHLAATVSDSTNQLRLWINGTNICTVTKPASLPFQGSNESLTLGQSPLLGSSTSWSGRIASLAFYPHSQDSSIGSNFQATLPVFSTIPKNSLVTWLQADKGLFQDLNRTIPATANNDPVAVWVDQSGSGTDFDSSTAGDPVQARGNLRLNRLNGKPVVALDGVMDALRTTYAYSSVNTVFLVARQTGDPRGRVLTSQGNNWLLGWWGGAADCAHFEYWLNNCTQSNDTIWRMYMSDQAPYSERLFRNGLLLAQTSPSTSYGPIGLALGGNGMSYNEPSQSEIAELIVYHRVLTPAERAAVFSYLSSKYGIALEIAVNPT